MIEPPRRAPAMPEDIDETVPNAARMYDYYLGGEHNFAVDRELGRQVAATFPGVHQIAMQNRDWLRRVVVDTLRAGIRQFLDIGSGVPTMGNVHEIVRAHLPEGERATVVYVDYEAVAVHHSRLVLERDNATDWATIVQEDVRNPEAILNHPETRRLIDFTRPVGLMLVAILPFVGPDDHPERLLGTYRSRLPSGSRLAISHGSLEMTDRSPAERLDQAWTMYQRTSNPVWNRPVDEIASFFGDWRMLHYPGLVHLVDWLPEPDADLTPEDIEARQFTWCGVAEKP